MAPATDAPQEVRVHVRSERGVSLATDQPRRELCRAPCTVTVNTAHAPFIAEVAGRPDSPTFELPRGHSALEVTVFPAATVLPGLAAVIGTVGLAGMGIGLVTLAADLGEVRSFDGTALAGGITALGGSAVLSVGLTMWFLSGTHVLVETPRTR